MMGLILKWKLARTDDLQRKEYLFMQRDVHGNTHVGLSDLLCVVCVVVATS